MKGVCGRGLCRPGFFDIDGPESFGCESTCIHRVCTGPSGTVTLTAEPLPETGLVQQALASGSSFGGAVQTSATHTNIGVLGESTPPTAQGAVQQESATHTNIGGFFVVAAPKQ